jgi:unsaturated chondroitin disaccharide hydrolase
MIRIDPDIDAAALRPRLDRLWAVSAAKLARLEDRWGDDPGAPVLTRGGQYVGQEWTDWTRGFWYGSSILQFDATGDRRFLEFGCRRSVEDIVARLTDVGVHDHAFNTVSTFGNLLRLAVEGRTAVERSELELYRVCLKVSGAVQAARWTDLGAGAGYIYSFNGAHSLFVDAIRTVRVLFIAHLLGHELLAEQGRHVSLASRAIAHSRTTAAYSVSHGEGRDIYDVRGRVAHESLFNVASGTYRCASTQQGYSPFTTWTRGLAWACLGFAEILEILPLLDDATLEAEGGREKLTAEMEDAARAVADYYLETTPVDGIPYWDTGAPGLAQMPGYLDGPADPFNPYEPVDSSAAAIAAQGLLRLGHVCEARGDLASAARYRSAGLTVAARLLEEPYLSAQEEHEGLLLQAIYSRPRGWDVTPPGRSVPCGEAVMWGDYHLRELAVYLGRLADPTKYLSVAGYATRQSAS